MSRYIGLDVHKRTIVSCIIDSDGHIINRFTFPCTREAIKLFAEKKLKKDGQVALEATTNSWTVTELLEMHVERIVVSNPLKTKAIAESTIKTDKVDAFTLAQLLRSGFLPEVWHPDKEFQLLRQLSVFYASLINNRTRVKNRLQSLFHRRLIHTPVIKLFSEAGIRWMNNLEVSEHDRLIIDLATQQVSDLNIKIKNLEKRIAILAKKNHQVRLLMTVPGISFMTAVCLVGAIGDVNRFKDADHMASYFGLVPKVKQSGDHCYYGSITKTGNNQVRKMLVLSAKNLRSNPGPLGAFFRRIAQRKHVNIASTATARKMITIVYNMLVSNEPYRYAHPSATTKKFGLLYAIVHEGKRRPTKIESIPNEPKPPSGYRIERCRSIDQVLVREGMEPIDWSGIPKGENTIIRKYRNYIETIQKPSATIRKR